MTSKRSSLFQRVLPRGVRGNNDSQVSRSFETVGGVYQDAKAIRRDHSSYVTKKVMFHGDIGKKLQVLKEETSHDSVATEPTCGETLSTSSSFDTVDSSNSTSNPSTGMIPFQWTRQESQRNLFANMSFEEEEEHEPEEEEEENTTSHTAWKSSSSPHHHDDAPLITLRSESVRLIHPNHPELQLGDDEVLRKVLTKAAKHLPRHSANFCSLHVMINAERVKHQVAPLQRMPQLDELARQQAKDMASSGKLHHADLQQQRVPEDLLQGSSRIGSNVAAACGDRNLYSLFHKQMSNQGDRNNILDRRYSCMGVGTSKGSDGKLYVCQVFA